MSTRYKREGWGKATKVWGRAHERAGLEFENAAGVTMVRCVGDDEGAYVVPCREEPQSCMLAMLTTVRHLAEARQRYGQDGYGPLDAGTVAYLAQWARGWRSDSPLP